MKKRSVSLVVLMGLLFLSASATFLKPSVDHVDNSMERLRTSAGEITIITPENKTYTEPDSGYYPATYGFENDQVGIVPEEWVASIDSGCSLQTLDSLDAHNNIVELHDNNLAGKSVLDNYFTNQETGIIEWWWRAAQTDKVILVFIYENSNIAIDVRMSDNGNFTCMDGPYNGSNFIQCGSYVPNQWYHSKVDFNCTSETFNFYIDGELRAMGVKFENSANSINRFSMQTHHWQSDFYGYWDAVGYSWDSNYNIGDNLNEGLLLSYENTTNLDWQGYSLDGQANRTILGNTTITMPTEGVHTIQTFGNDSVGTMYESGMRYFTVATIPPEINVNSPTPSQIISSTAPNYDLTIPGPYDSIWYTIDGGATNYTANSLTGSLNQAAWSALSDGIITIDFYANNSAGMEGSAQVQVIKDSSEEPPPGIPGYDLYLLLGVISVISALIIRKRLKS